MMKYMRWYDTYHYSANLIFELFGPSHYLRVKVSSAMPLLLHLKRDKIAIETGVSNLI